MAKFKRKRDAKNLGITVPNMDCEGNRFQISRICVPGQDLILYSETLTIEALEAELLKGETTV